MSAHTIFWCLDSEAHRTSGERESLPLACGRKSEAAPPLIQLIIYSSEGLLFIMPVPRREQPWSDGQVVVVLAVILIIWACVVYS